MQSNNKVLIITTNPKLYAVEKLNCELSKLGHECEMIHPDKLMMISNNLPLFNIIINRSTGLNYKDYDLTILNSIKHNRIANPIACSKILRDKYEQSHYFKDIVPSKNTIPTYTLEDIITYDSSKWIIKTRRGQQAKGVYSSTNIKEDCARLIAKGDLNYIVQPYIELIREWRFLYIKSFKDKSFTEFVILKTPKNKAADFKILNFDSSNTRLVKDEDTPKAAQDLARLIQNSLEYNFISVDIIEDQQGNFYFLEANSCPGLKFCDQILDEDGNPLRVSKILAQKLSQA